MSDEYDDLELTPEEEAEIKKIEKEAKEELSGKSYPKKRLTIDDPRKIRNLAQYRNMSDEEFEEMYAKKQMGIVYNKEFEVRIQKRIAKFAEDYDLDDLNSNDKMTLRALAQAYVNLDDYENVEYSIKKEGVTLDNIMLLEKISKMKAELRSGISSMSDDLKMTRKVRRSDKDVTVANFLEDLKKKAKEFYESKMQLIFCPKCHTWIGSLWVLFPDSDKNKITLVCQREMEDGTKCGEKITLTTRQLQEMGGTNKNDIPDSLK